jgi:hypothetical protein
MSKTLAQLIADPTQGSVNPSMGEQTDAESKSVVLSTGSKALLTNLATLLTAIGNNTDGLEGFTDGLEALLGTANTSLATIATNAASTAPSPVEMGPFTPKPIAASSTNAVLGATGAAGDYLSHIIIQPATTSPGVVTVYDGSTGGTNTTVYSFPGGASSVNNLAPIIIGLPSKCVNAGWHITTGANVSVTAIGTFT